MAPPKFTYFDIIGIGESVRLMFTYANVDFEDNRIKLEDWPALKAKTPNGNLPLLEVNGKELAQNAAISQYVAKLTGLIPEDDWEAARATELALGYTDILVKVRIFLELPVDKKRAFIQETTESFTKARFATLDAVYSEQSNSPWVFEKISWADFMNYNLLLLTEYFFNVSVNDYPNLKKFFAEFTALPALQDHFAKNKRNNVQKSPPIVNIQEVLKSLPE